MEYIVSYLLAVRKVKRNRGPGTYERHPSWPAVLRKKAQERPLDDFLRSQATVAKLVVSAAALDVVATIEPFAGRRLCDGDITKRWLPFLRGDQGEFLREDSLASVTRAKHASLQYCRTTRTDIRGKILAAKSRRFKSLRLRDATTDDGLAGKVRYLGRRIASKSMRQAGGHPRPRLPPAGGSLAAARHSWPLRQKGSLFRIPRNSGTPTAS
jgi:hypothetical protein